MIRLQGTVADGKTRRVLDITRFDGADGEPGISVWIHPPDGDGGYEIKFKREEILRFVDWALISSW